MVFFGKIKKLKQKKYKLPESCLFPIYMEEGMLGSLEYDNHLDRRAFVVRKFTGKLLWKTQLEQDCHSIVGTKEALWLTGENSLFYSHDQGKSFNSFSLPLQELEKVDTVEFYKGSLLVCVHRPHGREGVESLPRVIRLTLSGEETWSAELPVGQISYPGIQCLSIENGWIPTEKPSWSPENFSAKLNGPVLLSPPFTMITYEDQRSGIGIRYVLDLNTGDLIWISAPGPQEEASALPEGRFIIGLQGYGAFNSHLFKNRSAKTEWASHGVTFLTDSERLISIQLSNDLSAPQYVVELREDGSVRRLSDKLPGYYTTDVIQHRDASFYFWRGGYLWSWSEKGGLTSLNQVGNECDSFGTLQKIDEQRLGLYLVRRPQRQTKTVCEWIVFHN